MAYLQDVRMLQYIELKCNNDNRFYHILTAFNKLNKTCHTIVERGKLIPLTHKYTTAPFPVLAYMYALQ
jgi:hypothetical protein